MAMLKFAIGGTAAFGLAMLLLPGTSRDLFSWLLFGDVSHMAGFAPDALRYIALLHGVLGAVMVGWAISLAGLLRASGSAVAWIAASVGIWFVLDSAHSVWVGFWQNAVLNLGFAVLFGAGLALAARRQR